MQPFHTTPRYTMAPSHHAHTTHTHTHTHTHTRTHTHTDARHTTLQHTMQGAYHTKPSTLQHTIHRCPFHHAHHTTPLYNTPYTGAYHTKPSTLHHSTTHNTQVPITPRPRPAHSVTPSHYIHTPRTLRTYIHFDHARAHHTTLHHTQIPVCLPCPHHTPLPHSPMHHPMSSITHHTPHCITPTPPHTPHSFLLLLLPCLHQVANHTTHHLTPHHPTPYPTQLPIAVATMPASSCKPYHTPSHTTPPHTSFPLLLLPCLHHTTYHTPPLHGPTPHHPTSPTHTIPHPGARKCCHRFPS